jgi:LmbE family N-acetylglucosaminyl deacetylase
MRTTTTTERPAPTPPTIAPASLSLAALGTVLSVWAHPDDETYLAGGLMAAARDAGHRVVCATASAGERGTDDPATWPPERLGAVRRHEAAAAMAILGVDDHRLLGLPDGALADHHAEGVAWVGRLIDEVGPDTILTFGPDGATFHPDHLAVHKWVTAAWARRGAPCRLLHAATSVDREARLGRLYGEWGVSMTGERPVGRAPSELAVHVELTGAALDRKLAALRAMATQTGPLIAVADPDDYAAFAAEEAFVPAPRPGG